MVNLPFSIKGIWVVSPVRELHTFVCIVNVQLLIPSCISVQATVVSMVVDGQIPQLKEMM